MDIVLKLQGVGLTLTSRSGPVEVLRGIDMSLRQGEVLALIGPSGSGKSSALMLMAGLERASSGRIEALGHDLTPMDEEALARFRRGRLGIIFQNFHLDSHDDRLGKRRPPARAGGPARRDCPRPGRA